MRRLRLYLAAAVVAVVCFGSASACNNNPGGPHNVWNVVHPMSLR